MAKPEDEKKLENVFFEVDFPNAAQMLAAMQEYEKSHPRGEQKEKLETATKVVTTYDNW